MLAMMVHQAYREQRETLEYLVQTGDLEKMVDRDLMAMMVQTVFQEHLDKMVG